MATKQGVTGADIVKMLDAGIKPVVNFNDTFEHGSYAEKGMRARVLKYTNKHDEVVYLHFDFDEFQAINTPLETYNFYDSNRIPCLSARQTGVLKNGVEEVCVGLDYVNHEFSLAENTALFFEYKSLESNQAYVTWLEQQVAALRAQELAP